MKKILIFVCMFFCKNSFAFADDSLTVKQQLYISKKTIEKSQEFTKDGIRFVSIRVDTRATKIFTEAQYQLLTHICDSLSSVYPDAYDIVFLFKDEKRSKKKKLSTIKNQDLDIPEETKGEIVAIMKSDLSGFSFSIFIYKTKKEKPLVFDFLN